MRRAQNNHAEADQRVLLDSLLLEEPYLRPDSAHADKDINGFHAAPEAWVLWEFHDYLQ